MGVKLFCSLRHFEVVEVRDGSVLFMAINRTEAWWGSSSWCLRVLMDEEQRDCLDTETLLGDLIVRVIEMSCGIC